MIKKGLFVKYNCLPTYPIFYKRNFLENITWLSY